MTQIKFHLSNSSQILNQILQVTCFLFLKWLFFAALKQSSTLPVCQVVPRSLIFHILNISEAI